MSQSSLSQNSPRKSLTLAGTLGLIAVMIFLGIGVVANLDRVGRFFINGGNLLEAIACLEMMTSIESCMGVKDLRLADAWTDLSQAYARVPRLKDAIRTQMEAIRLRRELLGPGDLSVLTLTANMAIYESQNKDYGAAERDLKGTLALVERAHPPELACKGFILRALLDTYMVQKKYDQAEAVARQLMIVDDGLLPLRQYSYDGREKLAMIYGKTDRLPQAEPLLRESLLLKAQHAGPTAVALVSAHETLSRLLLAGGHKDKAQDEINKALNIIKVQYGETDDHFRYWKARYEQLMTSSDPLADEKQ